MPLIILRCIFLMVAAGLGASLIRSDALPKDPAWIPWLVFGVIMAVSSGAIVIDILTPRKRLENITAVYFGVIVGLFLTYAVGLALAPVFSLIPPPLDKFTPQAANLVLGVVLSYACISLLLQTKNDFRFIIPYVEFSKEVKGLKPLILDTSVIIDGRIADVVETKALDAQLIMPRFVIGELQAIADSGDKLRRGRGRRGLDILNRLRGNKEIDLQIYDRELPEFANQPVDIKLVILAKHLGGRIVTNDYNLNKVARLHGVGVINLNDMANALKPVFLPGEAFEVKIVKPGEGPGQGVGYLDDGTMVVVEGARDFVHRDLHVVVTSVLQTSAGRMVFARKDSAAAQDGGGDAERRAAAKTVAERATS